MITPGNRGYSINRRAFLSTAASAAAVAALSQRAIAMQNAGSAPASPPAGKPNSVIHGVKIGCITYSYRGGKINTAQETLNALLQSGMSEVELMDGPIMSYAGIQRRGQRRGADAANAQPEPQLSDEEKAKQRQGQLAKCQELRKMYNDAGVNIHIHKIPFGQSDEDIDFNFQVAKALGAVAITTERNEQLAKRVAPFADKHKIWVAFHNHTNNLPSMDQPDPILEFGKYIGFNLDIGHYFAGTKGKSPVPVIEKYHDRIVSLHLKDRTAEGRNLSWGKGQTPIKDVLQLLKKEKWPIYGDIEIEYPIPQGSNPIAEVAICLDYCRQALA